MAQSKRPNPTHLSVVFTRNAHMRREHIAGMAGAEENEPLTVVAFKGEEKKIVYQIAQDLIVQETAIDATKADNKERIAQIREEAKEETARERQQLKKAA